MPMNKTDYPKKWKAIALKVKEAAQWRCSECGKQCRKPHEPHRGHKYTLTTAHIDHDPSNPDARLRAMCAPCHLRYDGATNQARKACGKLATELFGEDATADLGGTPGRWSAKAGELSAYWHETHLDAFVSLRAMLKQEKAKRAAAADIELDDEVDEVDDDRDSEPSA